MSFPLQKAKSPQFTLAPRESRSSLIKPLIQSIPTRQNQTSIRLDKETCSNLLKIETDIHVFAIAIPSSICILSTVPNDRITKEEKDALLSLLDDPSPIVRKTILRTLDQMGGDGLDLLGKTIKGSNRFLSWHASRYLSELQSTSPAAEFRAFIRSMNYELESGWIMISRVAYPDIDVGKIFQELDEIANRCRELIARPASYREQCLVVNRVLFHEYGFRGNKENYNDPDNSFINSLLQTRKGLPITLSVLYLLVASRLGIPIEPIGVPGHFVIGCFEESVPFYIDSFERGKLLDAGQLLKRVEAVCIEPNLGHLAPVSTQETLSRICRNLVPHFSNSRQESMSKLFQGFLQDFKETYEKHV